MVNNYKISLINWSNMSIAIHSNSTAKLPCLWKAAEGILIGSKDYQVRQIIGKKVEVELSTSKSKCFSTFIKILLYICTAGIIPLAALIIRASYRKKYQIEIVTATIKPTPAPGPVPPVPPPISGPKPIGVPPRPIDKPIQPGRTGPELNATPEQLAQLAAMRKQCDDNWARIDKRIADNHDTSEACAYADQLINAGGTAEIPIPKFDDIGPLATTKATILSFKAPFTRELAAIEARIGGKAFSPDHLVVLTQTLETAKKDYLSDKTGRADALIRYTIFTSMIDKLIDFVCLSQRSLIDDPKRHFKVIEEGFKKLTAFLNATDTPIACRIEDNRFLTAFTRDASELAFEELLWLPQDGSLKEEADTLRHQLHKIHALYYQLMQVSKLIELENFQTRPQGPPQDFDLVQDALKMSWFYKTDLLELRKILETTGEDQLHLLDEKGTPHKEVQNCNLAPFNKVYSSLHHSFDINHFTPLTKPLCDLGGRHKRNESELRKRNILWEDNQMGRFTYFADELQHLFYGDSKKFMQMLPELRKRLQESYAYLDKMVGTHQQTGYGYYVLFQSLEKMRKKIIELLIPETRHLSSLSIIMASDKKAGIQFNSELYPINGMSLEEVSRIYVSVYHKEPIEALLKEYGLADKIKVESFFGNTRLYNFNLGPELYNMFPAHLERAKAPQTTPQSH